MLSTRNHRAGAAAHARGPLPHLLSLPEGTGADRATPRPVLCFLHGYDEAAPMEIRRALTRHGPLRAESWAGAREHFIIVAPQLPTAGDLWHRFADEVEQIVADVQREHGGDPARTYLTGFSFGGNGVFDLAIARPDRWAALWPVDPTRVPTQPIPHAVWLSVGEVTRSRKQAFVRTLALRNVEDVPEREAEDRLYLDEGADHVGSAALAYRDERVYAWLRARQRLTRAAPDS